MPGHQQPVSYLVIQEYTKRKKLWNKCMFRGSQAFPRVCNIINKMNTGKGTCGFNYVVTIFQAAKSYSCMLNKKTVWRKMKYFCCWWTCIFFVLQIEEISTHNLCLWGKTTSICPGYSMLCFHFLDNNFNFLVWYVNYHIFSFMIDWPFFCGCSLNKTSLFQIVAWCWTANKPLPDPMMA